MVDQNCIKKILNWALYSFFYVMASWFSIIVWGERRTLMFAPVVIAIGIFFYYDLNRGKLKQESNMTKAQKLMLYIIWLAACIFIGNLLARWFFLQP